MYTYACKTPALNTSKDMDGQIQLCDFIHLKMLNLL